MNMSAVKKVLGFGLASAVALVSLATAQAAQAYPAGQAPVLVLSAQATVKPSTPIAIQGQKIGPNCDVKFVLSRSENSTMGATTIATVPGVQTGQTAQLALTTPSAAGQYFVVMAVSGCANAADNAITSTAITVGGKILGKVTIYSHPLSATQNPKFVVSARATFGGKAVANSSAKITVKSPSGKTIYSATKRTGKDGSVRASFTPVNPKAGVYKVKVAFAATSSLAGATASDTTKLNK